MQRAAASVSTGRSSSCGNRDSALITSNRGTTSRSSQVTRDGTCPVVGDNVNVVGWGPIDSSVLGVACSWAAIAPGLRLESDIKVNSNYKNWYVSGSSCSGQRYDLESLAVHEFGHAGGLGHVGDDESQIMKPFINQCNLSQRSLGRGDQNGLLRHYGSA
ncbi:matrixin family metalloprotease [Naumannella huperziae]